MHSKLIKIPLVQKEDLVNIAGTQKEALFHLLNELVKCMEIRMMEKTLTVGKEAEVLYDKARIEGARGLKRDLNAYLKALVRVGE